MRKRRTLFVLAGCAVVAAAVALLVPRQDPEPVYQGKPLSEWLRILQVTPQNAQAADAIRTIGTNALPHLLRWISYSPPKWRTYFGDQRTPRLGGGKRWIPVFATDHSGLQRAVDVIFAFSVLGTNAAPAISRLVALAKSGGRPQSERATIALELIGPPAIPALLQLMTDQNRSSMSRFRAAKALSDLVDHAILNRSLGTNASVAVPLLIKNLEDKDDIVAASAASLLGRLKSDPDASVPALAAALQSTKFSVRSGAAEALGEFGTNASAALPILKRALADRDRRVRKVATNVVRRIAPQELPIAPKALTNAPAQ